MSTVPGRPSPGEWQGLLVSVRDAAEARAAVAGGADIIDVKEPAAGSLGMAPVETVVEVSAAVAGTRPLTLACGELRDGAQAIGEHVRRVAGMLAPGAALAAAKAGPAGLDLDAWRQAFVGFATSLPPGIEAVAVAYADWREAVSPVPDALIAAAAAGGCDTLLIDTCRKHPGEGFARRAADLRRWVTLAHEAGMRVAIAGGIAIAEVPAAVASHADVVAVRSAACDGGRLGRVCRDRVAALASSHHASAARLRLPPEVVPRSSVVRHPRGGPRCQPAGDPP